MSNGLVKWPATPTRRSRGGSSALPDTTSTGTNCVGATVLHASTNSWPSSTGRPRSRTTTSGGAWRTASSAANPSRTTDTRKPAVSRASASSARRDASSSTTSTEARRAGCRVGIPPRRMACGRTGERVLAAGSGDSVIRPLSALLSPRASFDPSMSISLLQSGASVRGHVRTLNKISVSRGRHGACLSSCREPQRLRRCTAVHSVAADMPRAIDSRACGMVCHRRAHEPR